ncbi:MAG: molybdenum cofactor guanylyltransferase [Nitrospirae bacterium]|nr:molybdenum cofactor guanylyltransferase [Nitrospirota bacterium]MBI4838512.1 molybdenum cofactor guanylyltransferase [Nitrospirota bacterium]
MTGRKDICKTLNHYIEADVLMEGTGIILAGGENKRMPVLKPFIEINGERIIERSLRIMKRLFRETFIVTNQPEHYLYLEARMLGDAYNIRGPMTGVVTALLNAPSAWVFVSACDMPFINEELIRYMASKRRGCDAVVPLLNNRTEPLFAFYSGKLLPLMEEAVLSGKTALKDFLVNKRVKYVKTGEIKSIDKEARSFINLNCPEDVRRFLSHGGKRKN